MKSFFGKCAAFILIFTLCSCGQSINVNTESADIAGFLTGLGWECGQLVEVTEVKIPAENDNVYKRYNSIQLENGFDLAGYGGRQVTRYTYQIKNHPWAKSRQVLANVLTDKGRIIGGDIMVTAADGFMHGLCQCPED